MTVQSILIDGAWVPASAVSTFSAVNPNTRQPLSDVYPVSDWSDIDRALEAAAAIADELRRAPGNAIAAFLEAYAARIEGRKDELVAMAHAETGLPVSPRLADVEFPRTVNQLRLAAAAAKEGSWRNATIDTKGSIRSGFLGIGPVAVFGPNNFPFAFGSLSGGDFAAAIAAGNPVIGKANSSHPGTTRLFAEEALQAALAAGLPGATVQLLYRTSHDDGKRWIADRRLGAAGYTGSRHAGLQLKEAADAVGKPIYLELSSINPVVILPGALRERSDELVEEFCGSCLMGAGQFCTNPGLVVLLDDEASRTWMADVALRFDESPRGTLLSPAVESALTSSVEALTGAGARILTTGSGSDPNRCSRPNTLLFVSGDRFIESSEGLQTEAFGNASLVVLCSDGDQMVRVLESLEGNLTGCIISARDGSDDVAYGRIEATLRPLVGRLLNDKMPTGVAVSPAMNHGGPFPATGHPAFTAVGIPASIHRFAMLACYDNVRPARLPKWLQDDPGQSDLWRWVDSGWRQGAI
ncbi:MAG TPA: aldehyde dehydrogenase (NADP(+)) [Pirellulaceae bacterium]|mgnify:FL=1|nr:aldehyde dehydrogenase (NADP(+)) [Pirellulaceae bacterium]